ncbi:MAG: hypothetical protein HOW73_35125 [Polyangiaceae bacterium]|nr:hypothetical protein [Polyangiaceae bacterium]
MRQYIAFDPKQGYPAAKNIAYECLICGGVVSSMPGNDENWECSCRNIRVDGDAGRVSVRDHDKMKAFYR